MPDGLYISWQEHLIDDQTLGGTVPIRGGDGLHMADLDHDDILDMISIHGESSYVRVVFGSDDVDTWFRLSLAEGREVRRPRDLAVGDADGDGFDDAVVATGGGHLLYLENPGGTVRGFRWGRTIPPATTGRGSFDRVSLADFDADGHLEVLAVNGGEGRDPNEGAPGSGISWFTLPPDPLNGDGWRENLLLSGTQAVNARPVDVDADGDLDVVAALSEGPPLVWFENTPAESGAEEETGGGVVFAAREFWGEEGPTGPSPDGSRLGSGDLNQDGRVDLVTLSAGDAAELLWIEQPADLSKPWAIHSLGTIAPDRVADFGIADINGDEALDVIVGSRGGESSSEGEADEDEPDVSAADPAGRIAWFANPNEAGKSWTRHDISRRAKGSYVGFVSHDIDQDGDVDFFVTRGGSGPFDGLIWLEQLHSAAPATQFTPGREEGEKPLGLPPRGVGGMSRQTETNFARVKPPDSPPTHGVRERISPNAGLRLASTPGQGHGK